MNLCGWKPRPSVIFPLHVYIHIQIIRIWIRNIQGIQPVPQTYKDENQVCLWYFSLVSGHKRLAHPSILVSNLIRPVSDGQHICTELSGWSQIWSAGHMCLMFLHTHTWLRLFFICGQPDGIFWPFHCFYDRALLSASSHISKKRGIRDKEWRWTALYTFLALYTICYTSPLLNCYTQYSYHSLWVFI